jgi:hypothetical protein
MVDLNPVPVSQRNVGGYDRIARALLGVVLFGIAVFAATAGRQLLAVFGMLASAGLLFNAATQFCGVNAVLGFDTCSWEPAENS